ncbi:DUF930 domain-containing protein [Ahrensia sp. R2A130]|uniref:DUF930 domain-containing protein n=1 Tax=Ahrensia sp. R2A130 TaxID=744979 RepID=UPI0018DB4AC6|nr:DUF930 domain-containing protein [Ahrensia sp. R2A130]
MPNRFALKVTSGSVISAIIHGLVLIVLTVDPSNSRPEPQEPEAIQVELVPPVKKIDPKPSEKPKPVVEQVPESKKTKLVEKPKVKPPERLRPVYKFGEEDAGTEEPVKNETPIEEKIAKALPSEAAATRDTEPEPAASKPPVSEAEPVQAAILRPATPVSRPVRRAKAVRKNKPTRSSQGNRSRSKTKRSVATTAKGNLTRSKRAGSLCVTELRNQLNNSASPRFPDRLPTYRLPSGTVLQVNKGAFRENARWINLKFRCEVDKAATVVVSFKLEVGTPIPRAQWRARGLPAS